MAKLVSASDASIEEAARLVLAGQLVAYPTDTVYGLGCNPFDAVAVDRLIQAKQRQKGALPILVNSMSAARRLGEFSRASLTLAGKFWPGPVTLVVPEKAQLPTRITDDSGFVGLRIPKHQTALLLAEKCGGWIVGTSANLSGHPLPRSAQEVLRKLGEKIEMILDGGATPIGKESSVVKILGGSVDVVREGAVPRDEILKALKNG
ncbi:MAG TPA: L-threonylcarbamoyladenylate synthase [Candidatus Dormibacteraeota bacterium]|nr:L-threonylcarbamoyladenylate synthase [Candidatus Dormibacteraeota bacterium]